MPDPRIRVSLADDHPIVLHGLQQLFERTEGFDVVSLCRDGADAIAAARAGQTDVLVLDLRMPVKSGLEVLRTMAAEKIPCKVVLLTAALRDPEAAEVVQLGARGLVLKESSPDVLIECVRKVHHGEQWFDTAIMTRMFDRSAPSSPTRDGTGAALTPREREIVGMVAQGLRNREIGQRLFISEGTVKIHLHNTYEKLGVDGRLELLLYAQERGWI
jgi:two-component system nitrate/nitrite response regulator NarL